MADEYIRLDTTIIGIDSLINKAKTAAEANELFKAKDVIYSQQRYTADVQPVKRGRWERLVSRQSGLHYEVGALCSYCNEYVVAGCRRIAMPFAFCPHCGADMRGEDNAKG